jgi:hypothetical protein
MTEWIKQYQRQLSMGVGVVLIVISAAWLFWDMSKSAVSDEEAKAAANVARMEARMSGTSTATQKAPDKPIFMDVYKAKQKEQLKYTIIIMMIAGIGFVGYSFIRRKKD